MKLTILSLGAGVQSTTLLLMAAARELPGLDCCVFADTGWEPPEVYRHLTWLEKQGVTVHRVARGDLRADALRSSVRGVLDQGERGAALPLYTANPDGSTGILRRQCTKEYKLWPIQAKVRELLGLKPRERVAKGTKVEMWLGISIDEASRMKPSQLPYITHRYPLIEREMSRTDCKRWLTDHGYTVPMRSACIGCPFRSDREWRGVMSDPKTRADAVEFDEGIRHKGGIRGELFLHRKAIPLEQVDLETAEEKGQVNMFENECEGLCGV